MLMLLQPLTLLLEVIKLEGHSPVDDIMPRDMFLLQVTFTYLNLSDLGNLYSLTRLYLRLINLVTASIIKWKFLVLPSTANLVQEVFSPNRTLDLTSAFETGSTKNKVANNLHTVCGTSIFVMTISFQFAFESHMQGSVASMARQYVRSIISSIQRVALALLFYHLGSHGGLRSPFGTPEAHTLARWICQSYRCFLGVELLKSNTDQGSESILKGLWHHSDAIICCSAKALPVFTFANQAGLYMLVTTLVALQDITLDKMFDDHGKKNLCIEFPQTMQQGFACLLGRIRLSSMSMPIFYKRVVALKVMNEEATRT
ncbi:Homeobox-leucine zipper protein ATHB-8 [Capsicum chinense]|nr:Homeobox-leucine zipper protein ATHB-8 [Capsicum chinense]